MAEDREKAEQMMVEYEYYKGQIEALQEGIALIDTSMIQIEATIAALNSATELGKKNEILVPVGSDSFLSATIVDTKNAIVGIGSDVAVKKPIKEAVPELLARKKELEDLRKERALGLEKVLAAAQELAPRLQDVINKAQKEG